MTTENTRRSTAFVTGASSGIGRATAVALAEAGHHVVVGYRADAEGARRTADAMPPGAGATLVRLDLGDPRAAAETVRRTAEELGGIDVFVNNAGVNRRADALEEDAEGWQRLLDVDLTGPFLCAQAAAASMVAAGRGGRIINVTSVHEHIPIRGGSAYCAAKAALGAVTKVMALELAEHGITVNSVAPGETATPMNGVPEHTDAADVKRPAIPAGRPGRPREVAALITHLASPAAAYTTGVSLTVDGGLSLMAAIPNQGYANSL
ncbi:MULTISPECIES: SDR family oxidoreductase [unclassified Streptomyces]|uniref:SDR family oxidoreductase n=1 Tax=unclassified Streptomyces TaxID=2593676 RepID=UPI002E28EA50|nr:SDR family oxidoreductase [Streptomyces sp. NBC_00272]